MLFTSTHLRSVPPPLRLEGLGEATLRFLRSSANWQTTGKKIGFHEKAILEQCTLIMDWSRQGMLVFLLGSDVC